MVRGCGDKSAKRWAARTFDDVAAIRNADAETIGFARPTAFSHTVYRNARKPPSQTIHALLYPRLEKLRLPHGVLPTGDKFDMQI